MFSSRLTTRALVEGLGTVVPCRGGPSRETGPLGEAVLAGPRSSSTTSRPRKKVKKAGTWIGSPIAGHGAESAPAARPAPPQGNPGDLSCNVCTK